jgi:peptidoglycan/xylan/chitin deacetylase (PgdA/CDA1 family)
MGFAERRCGQRGGRVLVLAALCLGGLVVPSPAVPAFGATPCRAGYVALTFDDGPSSSHTPRVLDVLAGRQVPATFFVIGSNVDAHPQLVARMTGERHEVANHTYAHERLTGLDDAAIRRTVDRTDRAIRAAGTPAVRLVRPPGGATSPRVQSVLEDAGYGHTTWTIDPQDWRTGTTSATITSRVLANLRPAAVILLHDCSANAPQTIAALPGMITEIRDRGYCFAPLDADGRLVLPGDAGPFRDVPSTSTHAVAITRLQELGITQGCGDDRYCPDEDVTRAQMASFLYRALDLPPGRDDLFRDVTPGSPHAAAIGALREAGITLGCSSDGRSYCPNDAIARDQMASLLQRAFELLPGQGDLFIDVQPGSTHAEAIGAVHAAGITRGCTSDGRSYCPSAPVSRAQMASFLIRALDHRAA